MAKGKGASAPPKSRPASAASATQAAPDAAPATLSAFSPRADLFALLTQALDRHRLRIYASPDARLAADYVLPAARAEALAWGALPPQASSSAASPEAPKKRKKGAAAAGAAASASSSSAATPVVALGLTDGSVALFSPSHGRVLRSLSDKAPASGPRGVRALHFSNDGQSLHAACADSVVRRWSLASPDAPPERTPAPQVSALGETSELLAASHTIDELGGAKRSWTGHASPVTHLTALAAPAPAASFVSAAANDRVLTLWGQGARPLATLPMTAPARQVVALSTAERALVLAITTSGDAGIYAVPAALDGSAKRTPALERVSSVTLKASKKAEPTPLLDAAQVGNQLYVAALVKGAKLVLERTQLLDDSSVLPPTIELVRAGSAGGLLADGDAALAGGIASTQRYAEPSGAAARASGAASSSVLADDAGLLPQPDAMADADAQADLDVNMDASAAEPTLAARLKGLDVRQKQGRNGAANGSAALANGDASESDDDDEDIPRAPLGGGISLAQTLTQALHSDDTALLSSVLVHNDAQLIRESVRRISGPLAVRLLEAAVVRMGQGQRSRGALGSQRAKGLVEWVRATLAAHTAYLMSLPNLVTRLAALHTVLSSRLASHDRLLALSGRLELVLAQIELRTAYAAEAAARAPVQGLKTKQRTAAAPKPVREAGRWVEGSSDEESGGEAAEGASDEELDDEADEVDVIGQASDDDDDASVEDVALGASTSMGATSGESDEEEENDEDDSEAGSDVDMADAAEGSAEEEEEEESDDPDALEDGEDESELDDDSDEVDEEEDDDEDSDTGKGGGLLDLEAEEDSEEESEEE